MNTDPIKMTFDASFSGELVSPSSTIPVGSRENGIKPYHMLYGALGGCFYATFISIAEKMRLSFSKAELNISGNKRDEAPRTLELVRVELTVFDPSHEEKLTKAAENGAKFCSIFETIGKVAKMELVVNFKKS